MFDNLKRTSDAKEKLYAEANKLILDYKENFKDQIKQKVSPSDYTKFLKIYDDLIQNKSQDMILNNIPIGDTGALALSNLLINTKNLNFFAVINCNVGNEAVKALCKILKIQPHLKCVDFGSTNSCNKLGIEGAKACTQLIRESPSIEILSLASCCIPVEIYDELKNSANACKTLKNLNLTGNPAIKSKFKKTDFKMNAHFE